jgi:hypothetical protein
MNDPNLIEIPPRHLVLEMWTIYDHPKDYPSKFVARKFLVYAGKSIPTDEVMFSSDIEVIRRYMRFIRLNCLARDPGDDPNIVETWL